MLHDSQRLTLPLPGPPELQKVIEGVFEDGEVVKVKQSYQDFPNRDAVIAYWAAKPDETDDLLLLLQDVRFRVVCGPDNAIVGMILWSRAQPYVWSMRFASPL